MIEEERKKAEILSRKRKLAYERNNIQHKYYSAELDRPDWNREYVEYLETQFIRDAALLSEEELIAPIMTREEFEKEQAVVLYREKANKAGELWDKALSELSSVTHKWKWEYMDYLEEIRFKDLSTITLRDAKEEILSYEEFAKLKKADIEVPKIEEVVLEKAEDVPEVIDYTKLSIEERASILQAPTDDYVAEYDAYCQRMGYTAEKMKSVRYKMDVYDEFIEEYQYRKKHCGMRGDSGIVNISEKSRGTR